jgi:hypothetical protein
MEEYSHLRLDDEYASTLHEILERRITDAEAALSVRPAQPVRFFNLVEGSGLDTKRAQHIEHSPFRLHMRLRGLAATSPRGPFDSRRRPIQSTESFSGRGRRRHNLLKTGRTQ